jgi:S1-C subfamily serine protease
MFASRPGAHVLRLAAGGWRDCIAQVSIPMPRRPSISPYADPRRACSRAPSAVWLAALLVTLFAALAAPAAWARGPTPPAPGAVENQGDLGAIVEVRARVPADARSAETLGTSRAGTGVVIRADGLALTIGYVVLEAQSIDLALGDGRTLPARLVAYDYTTGFGLVQPLVPVDVKPIALGDSSALAERDIAMIATRNGVSLARVLSRRTFAGYWEYVLENAIFTAPVRPDFAGAALIDHYGRLVGIGSLFVADAAGADTRTPGNMFVPVDALKPIFDELVAHGRTKAAPRPWLGISTAVIEGRLLLIRVAPESPADRAGLQTGDQIVAVGDEPVTGLEDLYRKVWARGRAGVDVPLAVLRESRPMRVVVRSIDREEHVRKPKGL